MNKDLSLIIAGRLFQIIIMLVSVRLLTTFLTPSEVGNYYIVLAILAFFNLVLLNPPGMYFSRHILHWQKSNNLWNALFFFILWILIVALFSIPVLYFIYFQFDYSTKFDFNVLILYIVLAIVIRTVYRNTLNGINLLNYRKIFVFYLITTLILGLSLSCAIVYFFYNRALGWLFGMMIAESIMLYGTLRFFIRNNVLDIDKIKYIVNRKKIKSILLFCVPIGITTFLMWGQNTAYRFIIDYKYSSEVLGYIAVGLGISSAVFSSIESISMQYFNPIFLKNILDASIEQRARAWNDIAKQIVPIYILSAFFTLAMAEVLINLLVDHKFHHSYIYTMIGVGIEFFRVMTNLLNSVSQSEYKTTATIKPYSVGFFISLGILGSIDFGTNYFMIPVVLAFAFFCVYIYMYRNMKKILDIRYQINLLQLTLLSLPFGIIYFIKINNYHLIQNLFLLCLFGVYFLFAIWIELKRK